MFSISQYHQITPNHYIRTLANHLTNNVGICIENQNIHTSIIMIVVSFSLPLLDSVQFFSKSPLQGRAGRYRQQQPICVILLSASFSRKYPVSQCYKWAQLINIVGCILWIIFLNAFQQLTFTDFLLRIQMRTLYGQIMQKQD